MPDGGFEYVYGYLEQITLAAFDAVKPPIRMSVSEAAEKYRKIRNQGGYVGPWRNPKTPYLVEPMDKMDDRNVRAVVFVGPSQSGKALALDTPIPTPDGWTTMGEIGWGDRVFGSHGHPVFVTGVSPVMLDHDCYRVTFDDGTSIVADGDHNWFVRNRRAGHDRVWNTRDMLEYGLTFGGNDTHRPRYCFRIKNAQPLVPGRTGDFLHVEPYLLGVWLGDGAKRTGYIAVSEEDLPGLVGRLEERGHEVTTYRASKGDRCPTVSVKGLRGALTRARLFPRTEAGTRLGLKRIPREYLRASVEVRKELLRGLMDTDGESDSNGTHRCEITQKSWDLICDIAELVRSLGMKPSVRERYSAIGEKKYGPYYRVSFSSKDLSDVFHMERKKQDVREAGPGYDRAAYRSIVSIEKVESVPVKCIAVASPDRLYLAGEGMVPTHNTDTFLNLMTYTVLCDPAICMLIQTKQDEAGNYSKTRYAQFQRATTEVGERVLPGASNDAVFFKQYLGGTVLNIGWPSIKTLSGKPIQRCFLTDFDRMDQDVEGEGNPFDLALARNRSFGRRGVTVAESSPGFDVIDPEWEPAFPHQAPPVEGILAVYNRGDCRRWMWPCVDCGLAFEPDFSLMHWPAGVEPMEAGRRSYMACPHCGGIYHQNATDGRPGRDEMNRRGFWLASGQQYTREGDIVGTPRDSDIATYWLKGPAAAFQNWDWMVTEILQARKELEETGSESSLRTKMNTVLGVPHVPSALESERKPEYYRRRAVDYGTNVVPEGVRFLVAAIDIQKNRFEVQVHGIGVNGDIWVIERFQIVYSERIDEGREGQVHRVAPFIYAVDWRLLVDEVLAREYELADGSGRKMAIRVAVCDSVGGDSTTANAYEFWRWLRNGPDEQEREDGRHQAWKPEHFYRFQLYHGTAAKTAPRVRVEFPDSGQKGATAGARGEIPVLRGNSDMLKDQLYAILGREERGTGMVHFPAWAPPSWYRELCVEKRDPQKGWINPSNRRNESWDLLAMTLAVCLDQRHVGLDRIEWDTPPEWAEKWDSNSMVYDPAKVADLETRQQQGVDTDDSNSVAERRARLGRLLA